MKNSILFKFLAILLCAASLTGIVGGTAGALVLAEGDLYNKTVDQVIDQRLQDTAFVFADRPPWPTPVGSWAAVRRIWPDSVMQSCPTATTAT